MDIALVIGLCLALFSLLIGYNIVTQQRQQIANYKRKEAAKHIAVIDATEELIGNVHNLPYSADLLICLNKKMVETLRVMQSLDPKDPNLGVRAAAIENQINLIKSNYQEKDPMSFAIPDDDRKTISMLKLVKKLRTVIKSEHTKGHLATQTFINENSRLEQMQLKINIENLLKRVNDAREKKQSGVALQLAQKAMEVINNRDLPYCQEAKLKFGAIITEIELEQHNESLMLIEQKSLADKEAKEHEMMFERKKKW
ncbi:MAG: DNA repair protein [Vibrionaceae bacterium]